MRQQGNTAKVTGKAIGLPRTSAPLPSAAPRRAATRAGAVTIRRMTLNDMRAHWDEWTTLGNSASEPNPFFENWFLAPALDSFDAERQVTLLAVEKGGRLAGIMPLGRSHRYFGRPLPHCSAWMHDNAFLGLPLFAKGAEEECWRAILDECDRDAGRSLFLHLPYLPADGPVWDALRAVLESQGRPAAIVQTRARALLQSDLGPDDYLARSTTPKNRKNLRRQYRRLSEAGELTIERRSDREGLGTWIGEFLDLEKAGWKGDAGSALAVQIGKAAFFERAMTAAGDAGYLERLALRLDGKPIAMLANIIRRPGAFAFKTAFDEAWSAYSPGVLLQRENLALLERDDVGWCDSCAAAGHPMIDRFWTERRHIAWVNIAIGGPVRRAAFRMAARAETGRWPSPKLGFPQ